MARLIRYFLRGKKRDTRLPPANNLIRNALSVQTIELAIGKLVSLTSNR